MRVAAVRVASFRAVRSDVRIPGPTSMTVPWKFAGRRIAVLATPAYEVAKIVSPEVLTPVHAPASST